MAKRANAYQKASRQRVHEMLLKDVAESDVGPAVRDLLTDIRHYCDGQGIDMHELLDGSYQVYLEERRARK